MLNDLKIILTGKGGHGIVFLTRLLARSAIEAGYSIIAAETHGMSQRGAPVVSHLTIGNATASQIQLGYADILIALDLQEAITQLPYLREGGLLIVNSATSMPTHIQTILIDLKIHMIFYDLNKIHALHPPNIVMAGILLNHLPKEYLQLKHMENALRKMSSVELKLKVNLQAFHHGLNIGIPSINNH